MARKDRCGALRSGLRRRGRPGGTRTCRRRRVSMPRARFRLVRPGSRGPMALPGFQFPAGPHRFAHPQLLGPDAAFDDGGLVRPACRTGRDRDVWNVFDIRRNQWNPPIAGSCRRLPRCRRTHRHTRPIDQGFSAIPGAPFVADRGQVIRECVGRATPVLAYDGLMVRSGSLMPGFDWAISYRPNG